MVSLLVKFQLNELPSGGEQEVGPSFTLPEPAAVKVKILSFLQASKGGAWLDTSEPLADALLNLHVFCVRSCVFVLTGAGGSSFLLQDDDNKKFAVKRIRRTGINFFILYGFMSQNKLFFRVSDIIGLQNNAGIPGGPNI